MFLNSFETNKVRIDFAVRFDPDYFTGSKETVFPVHALGVSQ
jgi:hypothetical protein